MVQIRKLDAALGAEVLDVDLRDDLEPGALDAVARACAEHGLLVFRGQQAAALEQTALCRRLQVAEASAGDGAPWRSDGSFEPRPAEFSIARSNGRAGSSIGFASAAAAAEGYPTRTIASLSALSATHKASADHPAFTHHPVVRVHPRTGRSCLFVNERFTTWIDDMESRESEEMLGMLCGHITQAKFQYRHTWAAGDVLLWDNCSMQFR